MIYSRLKDHFNKLCKRNLKNKKIKCCHKCPFEDDLIDQFPEAKKMFEEKHKQVEGTNLCQRGKIKK